MNVKKGGKMTIDKLALITKKGFDRVDENIDKLALVTKAGFDRVDEKLDKHDKTFHLMLKELKAMSEDRKYFRENISSLNSDGLSYNRKIENLTIRVEKLESNPK